MASDENLTAPANRGESEEAASTVAGGGGEPAAPAPPARCGLLDSGTAAAIAGAYYSTPFDVLGMHHVTIDGEPGLVIHTFQPQAVEVAAVREDGRRHPMER